MGFFAKNVDGRIDDPKAGWKGRGLWTTYGSRAPFHMETGKGHAADRLSLPNPAQPAGRLVQTAAARGGGQSGQANSHRRLVLCSWPSATLVTGLPQTSPSSIAAAYPMLTGTWPSVGLLLLVWNGGDARLRSLSGHPIIKSDAPWHYPGRSGAKDTHHETCPNRSRAGRRCGPRRAAGRLRPTNAAPPRRRPRTPVRR